MGGRTDPAINAPGNLLCLCRDCHRWVENHRVAAAQQGYLLEQRELPGAADRPVLRGGQWWQMSPDGLRWDWAVPYGPEGYFVQACEVAWTMYLHRAGTDSERMFDGFFPRPVTAQHELVEWYRAGAEQHAVSDAINMVLQDWQIPAADKWDALRSIVTRLYPQIAAEPLGQRGRR